MSAATTVQGIELDLSDVKRRVGQEVGGGELIEPCSATDIRRWVMAMDYANPIHWDHAFAAASKFRGIVAPQSFAVGIDYGHGVQPACRPRADAPDLWRRGMVALRPQSATGRSAHAKAALPRLQGERDEVGRPHAVLAR